jgi:hypothetical protein
VHDSFWKNARAVPREPRGYRIGEMSLLRSAQHERAIDAQLAKFGRELIYTIGTKDDAPWQWRINERYW